MTRYSFVLLVLAACPSKPIVEHPAPPATVAGLVHMTGTPCQQPGPGCEGPLAGYKVEVRAKNGTTVVATATTGDDGRYALTVPTGDYTILTKCCIPNRDVRNDFTAPAGETTTVDLNIDTGIR